MQRFRQQKTDDAIKAQQHIKTEIQISFTSAELPEPSDVSPVKNASFDGFEAQSGISQMTVAPTSG